MPAKPNNLLKPCPKCNKSHGTVQLLYSKEEITVRIGHYDSEGYKEAKKEHINSLKTTPENINLQQESGKLEGLKKKIRTKQRKWCSFRSNNPFILGLEYTETKSIDESIVKYFQGLSPYTPRPGRDNTPPKTIKLNPSTKLQFQVAILHDGWQIVKDRKLKLSLRASFF